MRYALIEKTSGLVTNLVEWNGDADSWRPPESHFAIATDSADIGDAFKDNEFVRAVSDPPATGAKIAVTMRQARLALLAAGKLAAVTAAIASLPSPQREAAQIEWEYAATVDRSSDFVQTMAAALQLDEKALNELFTQAATL